MLEVIAEAAHDSTGDAVSCDSNDELVPAADAVPDLPHAKECCECDRECSLEKQKAALIY